MFFSKATRHVLILGLLTGACQEHKNNKQGPLAESELSSPDAVIDGGVGKTQSVRIAPTGVEALALHYTGAPSRQASKVIIDSVYNAKVLGSSCQNGICEISYQQTELGVAEFPATISYFLIDQTGNRWKSGRLQIKGGIPLLQETATFVPQFGKAVEFDVPLKAGLNLGNEPIRVSEVYAEGGKVEVKSCDTRVCLVSFFYNQSRVKPRISIRLATDTMLGPTGVLAAEAEVIRYMKTEKSIFNDASQISLSEGVDYQSSWARPAHSIRVLNSSGVTLEKFDCADQACSAYIKLQKASPSFEFQVDDDNQELTGQVSLQVLSPDLQPTLQELVANSGDYREYTLAPGQGYESKNGALATGIKFDRSLPNGKTVEVDITDDRCDSQGVCRFKLRTGSSQAFVNIQYSLQRGSYTSPSQTLTIKPAVAVDTSALEFWDNSSQWYPIELRPGHEYASVDGSKAVAVTIIYASNMLIKDYDSFDSSSRTKSFSCDSEGVCRAFVGKKEFASGSPHFMYRLDTTTSTSPYVERSLSFKRDQIRYVGPNFVSKAGAEVDTLWDGFSYTLRPGVDYQSHFLAKTLNVRYWDSTKGIIYDQIEEHGSNQNIPCDEQGVCTVSGRFLANDGFKDLALVLTNEFGESAYQNLRLIRQKYSHFLPNVSSIAKTAEDLQTFEYELVIDHQPLNGYDGDTAAAKIQVRAQATIIGGTPLKVGERDYLEFPCDANGRCSVRVRAWDFSESIAYRLIGAQGEESIVHTYSVQYPRPFSFPQTLSVPSVWSEIDLVLPLPQFAGRDWQIVFDPEAVASYSSETLFTEMKVHLKLPQALAYGEKRVLSYQFKLGDQLSRPAPLTLVGAPVLRLKPQQHIKAEKQLDGAYSVLLKYGEHFEALPEGAAVQDYFKLAPKILVKHRLLIASEASCNTESLSCTYLFSKADAAPLLKVSASLLPTKIAFDLYSGPSEFLVDFE